MKLRNFLVWLVLLALLLGVMPGTMAALALPQAPATASPRGVLYFWDFEGDNGGFGATLDWEWGTYLWNGVGCYNTSNVPPPAAYSGTDMWGTVLNTCYSDLGNNANSCANANPNDDSILSFTIDLAGVTGNVELSWWEWYDLFGAFDWAEVRANGDVVWQNCESHVVPTAWEQQTVDLTAYAGGPVTIEFHMMASTVVNYAGWYIDDVMVTGEAAFSLEAWKEAPATAEYGDVISYTITLSTSNLLTGTFMADPLPAGVEYADNLTYTVGTAWYSPTVNTVFWEYVAEPRAPAVSQPAVPAAVDATLGRPAPTGAPFTEGAAVPFGGGATMAILDDFDRADGPIGPNWTVRDGYCNVSNNAAVCGNLGRATFNSAPGDGNVAEADVAVNGAVLQYTGLLLDYGAGATNLYLKVQDNNAVGQFTHAACYTGNNGTEFGLGFFTLSAPFSTAHMRATRVGNDVTIEFTNIDGGGGSQTYVCSGAPAPEGTGIGILGYGGIARLDNFGLPGEEPVQVQVTFDVTVTGHCGDVIVNEGEAGYDTLVETFAATTVVVGEPALAVSPPALDAALCPDTTGVHTLTICNEGDCPLEWELLEMTPTLKVVSIPPSDGNFPRGEGAPSAGLAPIEPLPDGAPITLLSPILGTRAYATEAVNGFHTQFDLDVPEVLPNLGAFAPGGFPGAGEYVNGYVYVADTSNTLYQLDPATGTVLNSYPITAPPNSETYSGFALDPTLGVLYGSSTNLTTSSLFQVDPTTGAATLIGPITGSGCNIAIAIDGTGQIYGYDICTDDFWAIDKNSGAGTLIGSIGFDANYGQGMGWDQATNQMYMTAFNNGTFQPELRIVDLTTGNTAMVGGALGSISPTGICQLPWLGMRFYPDFAWISQDPISGTVPWGECQDVAVTFDATGLAPGDQLFADLLILSNDPQTPEVLVPTTMTVLAPVDLVSVTYTIDDLEVTFDATATGSEPITYSWAFGDGNSSADEDPVHVYDEGGCYTVTLAVENACTMEEWSEPICVCEPVYGAAFSWLPAMPVAGAAVDLSATVGGGTAPFTYTWDFGDGFGGDGMDVSHTYDEAGDYVVELTVENACGTDVVTHTLTVEAGTRFVYLPIVVKNQ